MAVQLSPGVSVTEYDLTTIVPAVSSTIGAMAGVFRWGPVNFPVLIENETQLLNTFSISKIIHEFFCSVYYC